MSGEIEQQQKLLQMALPGSPPHQLAHHAVQKERVILEGRVGCHQTIEVGMTRHRLRAGTRAPRMGEEEAAEAMHVAEDAEHDLHQRPQLRRQEAAVEATVEVFGVHAAEIVDVQSAFL